VLISVSVSLYYENVNEGNDTIRVCFAMTSDWFINTTKLNLPVVKLEYMTKASRSTCDWMQSI
jgi:hypothetical protein